MISVSHLHYNVIHHGCRTISGYNYDIARNYLIYMVDITVKQVSRVNSEKDNIARIFILGLCDSFTITKWYFGLILGELSQPSITGVANYSHWCY